MQKMSYYWEGVAYVSKEYLHEEVFQGLYFHSY